MSDIRPEEHVAIERYWRALRRSWPLVLGCTILGVITAATVLLNTPPVFSAKTQFFAASSGIEPTDQTLSDASLIQDRVPSYVSLLESPATEEKVAERLGQVALPVAQEVKVENPLGTVLINVEVRDASPHRAYNVARALDDIFPSLVQRLEQPSGARSPIEVRTVLEPSVPKVPVGPPRSLGLALGLLGGLALGVACAMARQTLDPRVDEPERLRSDFGLTPLGSVVADHYRGGGRSLVKNFASSGSAEDYRGLRTNVQFGASKLRLRSVLVAGLHVSDVAPTVVMNLAVAIGISEARVLVVDADLRGAGLADLVDADDAGGLSAVLMNEIAVEEVIQRRWDIPFDLLPAGPRPPNPSELLASDMMTMLLAKLEEKYDLVLVHATPILAATDATLLAARPTGTMLVIDAGRTRRGQLKRAVDVLATVEAQLLGVVMTTKRNDFGLDASLRRGLSSFRMLVTRQETTETNTSTVT